MKNFARTLARGWAAILLPIFFSLTVTAQTAPQTTAGTFLWFFYGQFSSVFREGTTSEEAYAAMWAAAPSYQFTCTGIEQLSATQARAQCVEGGQPVTQINAYRQFSCPEGYYVTGTVEAPTCTIQPPAICAERENQYVQFQATWVLPENAPSPDVPSTTCYNGCASTVTRSGLGIGVVLNGAQHYTQYVDVQTKNENCTVTELAGFGTGTLTPRTGYTLTPTPPPSTGGGGGTTSTGGSCGGTDQPACVISGQGVPTESSLTDRINAAGKAGIDSTKVAQDYQKEATSNQAANNSAFANYFSLNLPIPDRQTACSLNVQYFKSVLTLDLCQARNTLDPFFLWVCYAATALGVWALAQRPGGAT